MISPELLAHLRRTTLPRQRLRLVAMVQLEQLCPGWWGSQQELADELGFPSRQALHCCLRYLQNDGLIAFHSHGNAGGTWVWWVKRHATDKPDPATVPCWKLYDSHRRTHDRIPVGEVANWALRRGIPPLTLWDLLWGRKKKLRDRWSLAGTPMDFAGMTDSVDCA